MCVFDSQWVACEDMSAWGSVQTDKQVASGEGCRDSTTRVSGTRKILRVSVGLRQPSCSGRVGVGAVLSPRSNSPALSMLAHWIGSSGH